MQISRVILSHVTQKNLQIWAWCAVFYVIVHKFLHLQCTVGGIYQSGIVDLSQNQQSAHLMGLKEKQQSVKKKITENCVEPLSVSRTIHLKSNICSSCFIISRMLVLLINVLTIVEVRACTLLQARCRAVFLFSSSSVRSALARWRRMAE